MVIKLIDGAAYAGRDEFGRIAASHCRNSKELEYV